MPTAREGVNERHGLSGEFLPSLGRQGARRVRPHGRRALRGPCPVDGTPSWFRAATAFATVRRMMSLRLRSVVAPLAIVCASSLAIAGAGVVKLRNNDAQEAAGGTWRLFMTISLPKAPSMAHVPMKFVFTETVRFERTLLDGSDEPQVRRVPVATNSPIVEVVDVGFGDARGKVYKDSRYDLLVNRERGFEAGEWKLQVKDGDGHEVGAAINLVLKGDNEVVDRRSMTFTAKESSTKKKSREERAAAAAAAANAAEEQEIKADGPPPPFVDPASHGKIAEEDIKVKKGACGCAIVPSATFASMPWALCAAFAFVPFARRRRPS